MNWNELIIERKEDIDEEMVNRHLNSNEVEIQKKLRKEYQKLLLGVNSELGKWLVENETGIKYYMPEIYTNAFYALTQVNTSIKNVKVFNEIGSLYKKYLYSK